ncbi:MAG: hypothetical protein WBC88_05315, partial [Candidatus Zixiibacteriota bacterium]
MVKKTLTIILTLAILFAFAAPAFPRWGPKPQGFGPVVLGHPWGDQSPRSESVDIPPMYRGSEAGIGDLVIGAATSFTVKFYLKYVAKKGTVRQVSIR